MKHLLIGLVCLLVLGCGSPNPTLESTQLRAAVPASATPGVVQSPKGTPLVVPATSQLPDAELAGPPPPSIEGALAKMQTGFRSLTDAEHADVRITAAQAERVGLATPGTEYDLAGDTISYTKVGCVFLGYYTGPPFPSVGYVPPTRPAYLVQVISAPVPRFPLMNIALIYVDAQTGDRVWNSGTDGGGSLPFGILGTTCGASI
jgi:hypothetical protein